MRATSFACALMLCAGLAGLSSGAITVQFPNGGESLPAESAQVIAWECDPGINEVAIEFSYTGGVLWETLTLAVKCINGRGSYLWRVPAVTSPRCLIRITARSGVQAQSDAPFTIFPCNLRMDSDGDCIITFADFAALAQEWLLCGDPYDPTCLGNNPPRIVSTPPALPSPGYLYIYGVQAIDPDGDRLTFELLEAPGGMSIDAVFGQILWMPPADFAGEQPVVVQVRDESGAADVQAFVLSRRQPPTQPRPPEEPIVPQPPQEPVKPEPPQEPVAPHPPQEPVQPEPPKEPVLPEPPQGPQLFTGAPVDGCPSLFERRVIVYTNAVRMAPQQYRDRYMAGFQPDPRSILQTAGPVEPVYHEHRLGQAARSHAQDMADNGCFQHNSCDGTPWSERIWSFYPQARWIGENIAMGYSTAKAVVDAWLCDDIGGQCAADGTAAAGHRTNIVNAGHRVIGAGYVPAPAGSWRRLWVQNFASNEPSAGPPIVAACHDFLLAGQTTFLLNYRDASNHPPASVQLVLDGVVHEMALDLGSAAAGTYRIDLSRASTCREYYFLAVTGAGETWRYPGPGVFLTDGEAACPQDYR